MSSDGIKKTYADIYFKIYKNWYNLYILKRMKRKQTLHFFYFCCSTYVVVHK